MKKIIEDVAAAEQVKEGVEEQMKADEQKNVGMRATKSGQTLKISGVKNEDLEKVLESLTTTIKVVGCGGAGTNTITRCFSEGINGAELIAVNTDAQHLLLAESPYKILIGRHLTRGLGAGSLHR
jgi:cell division protein FtsZ